MSCCRRKCLHEPASRTPGGCRPVADLRGHALLGIIAAIGTAGAVAALPLINLVHGPKQPDALRLPGYRRPLPVPTGRRSQAIAGMIVLIMVGVIMWMPAWVGLLAMLLAVLGLTVNLGMAFRSRRSRGALRERIRKAVAGYGPRFVIYTGRRNDASYQLAMWVPTLERLGVRYLVVLRHSEALRSTRAVTRAPIIVLPTGSDLDAIMVPGLQVAFYVNGIAENSTFVNYRSLTHVYLGHGDSDKELSVHPMHGMFDKVFVAGQAAIDRYQQAGVVIAREKFVIVGRPQLAQLDRARRPIASIKAPRVLYAPTWRGYNAQTTLSSLPVGPQIVSALIARGAVIRFRAHPFSWLGARERADVAAVDELLRRDREAAGRPHRLAAEGRETTSAEDFDSSDALITDIGSVLVDYFATGKPYAVVLPPGRHPDTAHGKWPSTEAAYLIDYDLVAANGSAACTDVLADLLGDDPLQDRRPTVAQHYLGEDPGDDRVFLAEVRKLLDGRHQHRHGDQQAVANRR
jgi:hypothetical protein